MVVKFLVLVTGVLTLVVLASTAFGVASTPGSPATPGPIATSVPEPPPRTALEGEMTVEQELEIAGREGPRGTALNQVLEAYPDDYAYGYITDEGFGVGFKAEAPPAALAVLDAVGDPYELHENVGFTELDLAPQLARAVNMVQKAVGKQGMSGAVNVFTVTVEIELYPDSVPDPIVLDPTELDELMDTIRPELYPGFDIAITSVPDVSPGW